MRVSLVEMLRTVTVAPVITACFSSLTSPEIDPEFCANAVLQRHASKAAISIKTFVALIISILLSKTTGSLSLLDFFDWMKRDDPENADEVLYDCAKLWRRVGSSVI